MKDLIYKKCKLCGFTYVEEEMSEEHYPARNTGNEDIVSVSLSECIDMLRSEAIRVEIIKRMQTGEKYVDIVGNIFDTRLSTSVYPLGRTSRTLCRKCNTFLGKYDEAYLKFFNANGDPKIIKGFQDRTKYQIIKAIYAKFLSVPETVDEEFDFIDFIRDEEATSYDGNWTIYFVKRDLSSDILGLKDLDTGKMRFDEGVVYEMSDDKFIFNLMNFKKHSCFDMTNLRDILTKKYTLIKGVGDLGGYHGQIMLYKLLSGISDRKSVYNNDVSV